MVGRPKCGLAPEIRGEVSCDDTGRRPVLRGRKYRIRYGQPRLFHRQAGVFPRRESLRQSPEDFQAMMHLVVYIILIDVASWRYLVKTL